MMTSLVSFQISQWSAIVGDESPKVAEFPAMLVRRASRTDRVALRAGLDCAASVSGPLPTVFASRHGEVHRSVELLESLAQSGTLSPTSFSLSVHNAAAGLFSIGRQDRSPSTSLAAGVDSLPMAVLEAVGMLHDGAPRVLVVAYDEQLPATFQPHVTEEEPCAAVALLLERDAGSSFSLELVDGGEPSHLEHGHLPPFLGFLEQPQTRELCVRHAARGWRWLRNT